MRRIRIFLLLIVAGLIGYYIGVTKIDIDWKSYKPQIAVASKEPPATVHQLDMSRFWIVLERLQTSYYDKTKFDSEKLLNGAISGMVGSLDDAYTVYLPPAQNEDFKDGLAGRFEGIGAELGMQEKQIIVVAPLDGSPAQKAGIRPGDAILKVGDEFTPGWTLSQAVEKIRGPKGSQILLTIQHRNEQEPKEVTIVRDTITVKSVTTWVKPIGGIDEINVSEALEGQEQEKVAYMRLSQFGDNTNAEWVGFANEIDRQIRADSSIQGIVLDLRNNPGGYLTDAVFISSEFLKSGSLFTDDTVVIQEDGKGEQMKLPVSRRGLLTDVPLVVLINKGSASASEIVAGALRDHNRAKLVGETSFGKGTIQSAEDLGGGAGLHVTIAKWLTPKGTWVHQEGLTPDVEVAVDERDQAHDLQLERAIEELLK